PGVGKTAIIEGLARKISEGDVPNILSGKKIHRLDLASLIAGTMYRGEFENRLRQLVDEVAEREDVILFIDEVHTIMGAGSASGSLDVANILKPALARGEIRCIGATTSAEYKKFIETDGALERRFEPIRVSEPSEEKTKEILQGILKFYEEFHNVTYTETAIEASIKYAGRYLTHKNFPDKAIDLLDEAGASVNVKRKDDQKTPDSTVLTERLKQITAEKNEAVMAENFAKAVELKDEETKILLAIDKIILAPPQKPLTVSDEDIIEVVAEITGIPLQKISQKEYKQLDNFEKELKKSVFGQVETVARVAQAIRRARLDIQPTNQPLSSFLFVGPSGVGKTELAKAIAKNLFHDQKAFLRLDMSEYSDKFTASKLIGAPAGYVGYRESSLLTDHVKEHPHSVVLFDEIEKAHPDIHNLLLQILDNGMITDATGRKVNFRNAVIIMTSNVGSMRFEQSGLGFSEKENTELLLNADLRKLLETSFSKEFLNRINHTCVFRPLDNKILKAILKKELKALSVRLQNKSANLKWTPEIEKYLLKKITPKFGARDVKRIVEQEIEHHLTDTLLKQTTSVPFSLELGILKNGKLFIKTKKIR
ncbi:ATP-dependent Clp protease ATP-binding subunit ClpC, partial [Candidatus Uhrbacteria bacterium CG_4_10_14_0_2_um_filter_41_7]